MTSPDHTESMSVAVPEQTPRTFMAVVSPILWLLAIMWLVEIADFLLAGNLDYLGVQSRTLIGLVGIAAAPFLHGDFEHLMANTVPFLILGSLVSWRAREKFWNVFATIVVVSGTMLWLLGPANVVTVGASGVIFGFLTYLLASGVITRHWVDVLVAVIVLIGYGSLLLGMLPVGVGADISWQMHLFGALAGVLAAIYYSPPKR